MSVKPPPDRRKFASAWDEVGYLYDKLLYWLYQREDALHHRGPNRSASRHAGSDVCKNRLTGRKSREETRPAAWRYRAEYKGKEFSPLAIWASPKGMVYWPPGRRRKQAQVGRVPGAA